MTRLRLVEPLARVEGHGAITVELDGRTVTDVRFDVLEGPRLIERLLVGKSYDQVGPIVARICSICSSAHMLTSITATENAFGVEPGATVRAMRELLFRGENIGSHALHLFVFALPDSLGAESASALAREHPDVTALGLRIMHAGHAIQELVGGRAIHPITPVVGGFARRPTREALERLRRVLMEAEADVRAAVRFVADLPRDDFVTSTMTFAALEMRDAYGYYAAGENIAVLSSDGLRRYAASDYARMTNEVAVAHGYAKHSACDGAPLTVGALARVTINRRRLSGAGEETARMLGVTPAPTTPMDNNRAQLVELVMDVERSRVLIDHLLNADAEDGARATIVPRAGAGTAAAEAPRGLLVHRYEYDGDGRIVAADIVTPTAINAASIERRLREAAMQLGEVDPNVLRRRLEIVVRAHDPCISCAVHLVTRQA